MDCSIGQDRAGNEGLVVGRLCRYLPMVWYENVDAIFLFYMLMRLFRSVYAIGLWFECVFQMMPAQWIVYWAGNEGCGKVRGPADS